MGKSNTEFNWRVARRFALAACLAGGCLAAGSLARAQAASATQGSGSHSRLLSAKEGRAIVERSPVAASASNRAPKAASERTRVVYGLPALPAPAVAPTTFEVPQSI